MVDFFSPLGEKLLKLIKNQQDRICANVNYEFVEKGSNHSIGGGLRNTGKSHVPNSWAKVLFPQMSHNIYLALSWESSRK